MNFLCVRRLAPWMLALAAAGCGSGAADPSPEVDAAVVPADVPAPYDAAGLRVDLAPAEPCTSPGTGRLRVSLGLDPALSMRTPEVWLLVRCGLGGSFERVLRWDRTATQTIDALPLGTYEVIGSSMLAPWASSTRMPLADGATAAVSLTLPPGPPVLALARSAPLDPGAPAVWRATVPLASGSLAASVATIEVEARPYAPTPPSTTGETYLSVTAVVRNPCANDQCPPYLLRAVEVRTRAGDSPAGLQGFQFASDERLEAGQSKSVPQPMMVRGALPDAAHAIELALYGEVARPATARP